MIKNKKDLYLLLRNSGDNDIRNKYISFLTAMYDLYNGCRCTYEIFIKKSDEEYKKILSTDKEFIEKKFGVIFV